MTAAQVIGESIVRLAVDYDQALRDTEGDEQLVPLYLPDLWCALAREVFALIMSESHRLAGPGPGARLGKRQQKCAVCGSFAFMLMRDMFRGHTTIQCASCGADRHE